MKSFIKRTKENEVDMSVMSITEIQPIFELIKKNKLPVVIVVNIGQYNRIGHTSFGDNSSIAGEINLSQKI